MILAALALAASAPSFDCAKASTEVEKMICGDEEVAAVDRAVARLYAGLSTADRRQLFTSQADWLNERNACNHRKCLLAAYDDRLFDIFTSSKAAIHYGREGDAGTLSLIYLGAGWYAFKVVGLWIGANPGQVNDTMEWGHFRLVEGKAEEPADDAHCGWEIERISRHRWQFTEVLPDNPDMIGCGGLNASATGVYSL